MCRVPHSAAQTAVWPAVSLWSLGADGTNCSESSASDLLYISPAGDEEETHVFIFCPDFNGLDFFVLFNKLRPDVCFVVYSTLQLTGLQITQRSAVFYVQTFILLIFLFGVKHFVIFILINKIAPLLSYSYFSLSHKLLCVLFF